MHNMKLLSVATLIRLWALICALSVGFIIDIDLLPSPEGAASSLKRELPLRLAVEAPTTQPRTRVTPIVD